MRWSDEGDCVYRGDGCDPKDLQAPGHLGWQAKAIAHSEFCYVSKASVHRRRCHPLSRRHDCRSDLSGGSLFSKIPPCWAMLAYALKMRLQVSNRSCWTWHRSVWPMKIFHPAPDEIRDLNIVMVGHLSHNSGGGNYLRWKSKFLSPNTSIHEQVTRYLRLSV